MSDLSDTWYRYEDFRYAPHLNEFDEPVGPGRASIRLLQFEVLKHTPCGVWIDRYPKRWVKKDARKRFACPTKEEAMESFIARKNRQRKILKAQVRHVDEVLRLVEKEYSDVAKTA